MKITSDPNDPEFREALRKIGAPEWYPQDAPNHQITGKSAQNKDGTWTTTLRCSICGWEKRCISGKDGGIETINKGNEWAFHIGGTDPEILRIKNVDVVQEDDKLKPFEDFFDEKRDD